MQINKNISNNISLYLLYNDKSFQKNIYSDR